MLNRNVYECEKWIFCVCVFVWNQTDNLNRLLSLCELAQNLTRQRSPTAHEERKQLLNKKTAYSRPRVVALSVFCQRVHAVQCRYLLLILLPVAVLRSHINHKFLFSCRCAWFLLHSWVSQLTVLVEVWSDCMRVSSYGYICVLYLW